MPTREALDFIRGFDFIRMHPDASTIVKLPEGSRIWMLSEPGRRYAAFLLGAATGEMELSLPAGSYHFEWIDPLTGELLSSGSWTQDASEDGNRTLETPGRDELGLKMLAVSP